MKKIIYEPQKYLGVGPRYNVRKEVEMSTPEALVASIKHGDKVTILVPAGIGRDGQEWKEKTGRAVMRGPAGWVLNMGGPHGTPGIATEKNTVAVKHSK
jgi:hypothetical protein